MKNSKPLQKIKKSNISKDLVNFLEDYKKKSQDEEKKNSELKDLRRILFK